jgi:hypothetical protein
MTDQANEAGWDRALRIAVGALLLALGWTGAVPGWWALGCKLFGLFPLLSGLIGWDPVYALLGFRTRPRERAPRGGTARRLR